MSIHNNSIYYIVFSLLFIHTILIIWSAYVHSPNPDEVAHLPCGLSIWKDYRYDLYSVNPPLVRMIASSPLLFSNVVLPNAPIETFPRTRLEFEFGNHFLQANKENFPKYFFYARIVCIPLSILGGLVCFLWSKEIFGSNSGIIALSLWCFSPNVLTWAATICPDLAATSLGILAGYCFWKWNNNPTCLSTILTGVTLALCVTSKFTWIILFGTWPLLWFIFTCLKSESPKKCLRSAFSMLIILILPLLIINILYCYDGTLASFGKFQLRSQTARSLQQISLLGVSIQNIPIPLPEDFIYGIDLQKLDFESGRLDSYLLGEWRNKNGWWYYYLIGMIVKVPLGTVILFFYLIFLQIRYKVYEQKTLIFLAVPPIILFVFISSQTGFSRHFRYVLPVFPFIFIAISGIFNRDRLKKLFYVPIFLLLWSITSCLYIFPHTLSFFNEIAGGPKNGYRYMLDSSIDWQQDLYFLRKWINTHPEVNVLYVDYYGDNEPYLFDINTMDVSESIANYKKTGIWSPGWYAISVHELYHQNSVYHYFKEIKPVATIGFSINIYHIQDIYPRVLN
jgi:hypothetical protein